MRKFLQRMRGPYSLRQTVAKNMPLACCFAAPLIAVSLLQEDWFSAGYFTCLLVAFVCVQVFARNEPLWNRYMAWLPDSLKDSK